jgi:hypothetical protein
MKKYFFFHAGSIPAAAAQAGFTHCAANYDFTQTQQWTDAVGLNGNSPRTQVLSARGRKASSSAQ